MRMFHHRTSRAALGAALAAAAVITAVTATAHAAEGTVIAASGQAIEGSYIVVFKDGARTASVTDHVARFGGTLTQTYSATLQGYAAKMTESQARRVAADPAVAYVEQDGVARIADTQPNATWGLDRTDQHDLPLDQSYTYPADGGKGVTAYVIDTGVRISHQEFGGRARYGKDFIDNDNTAQDGNGHGTHVAGTIGGKTYGIAKNVDIVAVRVLDNGGTGAWSAIIGGIDWAAKDAAGKKAVGNLSIGGGANQSVDDAVRRAVRSGLTLAIAAGNNSQDAGNYSPARVSEAITVGATDRNDNRASFSNYGSVLDIFAPGDGITSATNTTDTATKDMRGTSMAAPHVAGVTALLLADGTATDPATAQDRLKATASKNKVKSPGIGSPNNLLYSGK